MAPDALSPVYLIALLQVPDVDSYRREFGRKVHAQVMADGGKLLVASPNPTILEGEWESGWTAVIQFSDRASAMRWYQSNQYTPLKKLRVEELTTGGTIALFDGNQPQAAAS